MALYLQKGKEDITEIKLLSRLTNSDLSVNSATIVPEMITICAEDKTKLRCFRNNTMHINELPYRGIEVKFKSESSREKFLEKRFSNKRIDKVEAKLKKGIEKIDRLEGKIDNLEGKIDELKELIYYSSLNGPGFKEAKKDYDERVYKYRDVITTD